MLYISVQCVVGIHCVGYARDWIAIILDLPLWLLPKLINLKPTNNANATFWLVLFSYRCWKLTFYRIWRDWFWLTLFWTFRPHTWWPFWWRQRLFLFWWRFFWTVVDIGMIMNTIFQFVNIHSGDILNRTWSDKWIGIWIIRCFTGSTWKRPLMIIFFLE